MTATLSVSRPIRQLPVELANQIAAGEVVERPASVVKELVENSLDAGASRIEVHIQHGGLQAITVRDNGCGIPESELPLAISRHATSKIINLQELENILSLGFRGEALASIGSVSRMTLTSRTSDSQQAWLIDCETDDLSVQPTAHPQGTSISVQDLFYNTPARRKFMRTEKTEFRHIDEVVRRMALSHFEVGFTFQHNERTVYQLAPAETDSARNRRVSKLCGKGFMDHAMAVNCNVRGLKLTGWLTGPEFSRSQNDLQHFYVNGRIIRDRLITHAIRQVYQEWIPAGRHAGYVLHFEIEPGMVDVNVHPTKHEVRFREARMVHDFIHRSLRETLSGSTASMTKQVWSPGQYESQNFSPAMIAEPRVNSDSSQAQARFLVSDRFIIAEQGAGLMILDARLAMQQLITRKMTDAFQTEGMNSRPLLIPKSFTVTANQLACLEGNSTVVKQLGFEISINGPESILLRKIPLVIAGADLQAVINELFSGLRKLDVHDNDLNSVIGSLAKVAAESKPIETGTEELNRLLGECESLNDPAIFRCLNERDLQKLINHP
ncbi:MAG: DNA mismatch repair endonuclease MutL [Gammaproteobacteria bacterium]|nr:DNA mismatch repair endonuclease MutL [Gammaproteobacteria bacterium]